MPKQTAEHASYDRDYHAWLTESAALLREGCLSEVDLAQIAEELEDMGRSERRAIESYLKVLIVHLLKWQRQPERRGSSWQLSIANSRDAIGRRLRESPSLRPKLSEMVAERYPNARQHAALEMGLDLVDLPDTCPFTVMQLLDDAYWGE
ncbi:MAG: DUF29 domain-containing protein [Thiocapsa sp.]|uniref:DUF29 domain-containing protein n=1 Tax=Thiocapsa sp. TaxID=2024551 RepID=UPI001BCEBE31|nr:DUF29 domain-containing protein [Thiocapsa sp.]QVL47019.1 MAG: DUF29 domain-containing protein [Thiocapsa sp.]